MTAYFRLLLLVIGTAAQDDNSGYVQVELAKPHQARGKNSLAGSLQATAASTCVVTLYEHWHEGQRQDYTGDTKELAGVGTFPLDAFTGTSTVKVTGEGCLAYGYTNNECSGNIEGLNAIRWDTQYGNDGHPLGVCGPSHELEKKWGCNDCVRCVKVEQTAAPTAPPTADPTAAPTAAPTLPPIWTDISPKKECGTDDSWDVSTKVGDSVTKRDCQDDCAADKACIGYEYGIGSEKCSGNAEQCWCWKITGGCSKQRTTESYDVSLKPIGEPWPKTYESKECGNADGWDASIEAGARVSLAQCQRQCQATTDCIGYEYGKGSSKCDGDDNCKCYIITKSCSKQQTASYDVYIKPL